MKQSYYRRGRRLWARIFIYAMDIQVHVSDLENYRISG